MHRVDVVDLVADLVDVDLDFDLVDVDLDVDLVDVDLDVGLVDADTKDIRVYAHASFEGRARLDNAIFVKYT